MKIDQEYFHALLRETIDENSLACRAIFSICQVDFTGEVDTLAVTLGSPSILKVNLDFLSQHCDTEEHVKAVLIHEFLHLLLGHTLKFDKMTRVLNIALDAVINAIIHRKMGEQYSSLMRKYYSGATGILSLLRPMDEAERSHATVARLNNKPVPPLTDIHAGLYGGRVLTEDIFSIAQDMSKDEEADLRLNGKPTLLGGHCEGSWRGEGLVEGGGDENWRRIRRALGALDGSGIFRDADVWKPRCLTDRPQQKRPPAEWRMAAGKTLQRMLAPDQRGVRVSTVTRCFHHPVINAADRRGSLRVLWSPLIPDITWHNEVRRGGESVNIYLDVSGSMTLVLNALVGLLGSFSEYIRRPLWAFSTTVQEAQIVGGRLTARTTGGTSLACVRQHILRTKPRKALIVTDGFVEGGGGDFFGLTEVEALIPHDGYADILVKDYRIPTTRLSKL